jgi:UDP:flavonoid glycosyltransferase YjiC (YdhE family)
MFQTILDALRDEPINVVATVGPDGDMNAFNPLPAHMRIEKFVPQDTLLPHCAAVVCHAGAGTVLGALGHGVPLLVMMLQVAADHYEVASQIVTSGAGLSLPEGDLTAVGVRESLRRLLSNPDYQLAARRIGAQIASIPSPIDVAAAFV